MNKKYEINKFTLIQIGIAVLTLLFVLLIYNFNAVGSYQDMAEDIKNDMFTSPEVSAVLLTYRNMGDRVELTVNVSGVEGEIKGYRAEALAFVCQHDEFQKALSNDKSIDVKLNAMRRKHDKYLQFSVTPALCSSIN
uniref:hypothetical protein n=1 Tax=Ningiella ruwaisensis TaxID=2364274 RepID=UPI0010A01527|nr:hypothetical protein [Ningiella ruwaisensis]